MNRICMRVLCAVIHDKFIIHEIVTRTPSLYRSMESKRKKIYEIYCISNWGNWATGEHKRFGDHKSKLLLNRWRRENTVSFQSPVVVSAFNWIKLSYYFFFLQIMYRFDWTKKTLQVIITTGYCIIISIHDTRNFDFPFIRSNESKRKKRKENTTLTVGEKASLNIV